MNSRSASIAHKLTSIVLLFSLLLSQFIVVYADPSLSNSSKASSQTVLKDPKNATFFRTRVLFRQAQDLERLEEMGVVVLEVDADSALLLVTADQLEALARLRLQPASSDELGLLVNSHAAAKPWLAQSMEPALQEAARVWQQIEVLEQEQRELNQGNEASTVGQVQEIEMALTSLQEDLVDMLHSFTAEQLDSVGVFTSIDSDGDGLTNTEETWWCTDPENQDTDADGRTDGNEIEALRSWIANERSGTPLETPWPDWPFDPITCPDKDYDSIPNLAERWDLGLNMDLESSDRDRYDDGQELFGVTHCPGGGNACGYGTLPSANHDGIVLFPQMPSWVTFPGKHPLVAALPKLEFSIVPDNLGNDFQIQTATVVTTDERHEEGETRSYSTTKTEGTSTGDTQTETWENWQEYSKTTEADEPVDLRQPDSLNDLNINSTEQYIQSTNIKTTNVINQSTTINRINNKPGNPASVGQYLGNKQTQVADYVFDEACAEFNCKKYTGSAIGATVRTFADVVQGTLLGTSDTIQNEFQKNKCDLTGLQDAWCRIKSVGTLWKTNYDERLEAATIAEQEARGLVGGDYLATGGSYLDLNRVFPITFPEPRFIPTETNTTGSSTGGSRSTTHTQYEEHGVTEGTSNQFGTSWGNATAEDSVHTADLWFAYELSNVGNDYARVICDLAINVYIDDDRSPVATYFPGGDLGGDGCFSNFRPGETHKFSFPSGSRIALTLDQMARLDQGGTIHFVVEDYSLGQDDFYADDAVQGGITVSINDGSEDGDDLIDTYIIPTWGEETVVDVIGRYFPHNSDENDLLTEIWTPEYRSDVPSWCVQPKVVGIGSQRTLWCKHALSAADWWNIYLNGLGDGTQPLQDTLASPGSLALFRFNKDTDLDGYSDHSEWRLGTDANNSLDFPQPKLLAGLHNIQSGNNVISTLSFLNTGLYDAYGVEAVMIAPDSSVTITNNTVGGAGRVGALDQVVVGSRVMPVSYSASTWRGTAQPVSGGYYAGAEDRVYIFTAQQNGSVGSGSVQLHWNDGIGNSGLLDVGSSYASPTMLTVGVYGLEVGLLSGSIQSGDVFSISARIPTDTFQYQIQNEPHTEPVVILSYNDPQGNHRFVTPVTITNPTDNIALYSGQMLENLGAEIVTQEPITSTGSYTTDVLVNWPTNVTLQDAHLFLEFVNITGTVAAEIPITTTIYPGPNVVSIDWDTDVFSPTFQTDEDYIVMIFWTDWQGNIIHASGRPLSTFQDDPNAAFATNEADLVWGFGTARQGTLMQRQFQLASVGFRDLQTYIGNAPGITLEGPIGTLLPADMGVYTMTINTEYLPVGVFTQTIPIRTSDPSNPTRTIFIQGEIQPFTPDDTQSATIRPLDVMVTITGTHAAGEWVTYTHTLGPTPQTLHPIKMYSLDYTTLWGVGKNATDFDQSTASANMFGDGSDGDLTVPASQTHYTDNIRQAVTANANSGQNQIAVANGASFAVGGEVLIIQMQGAGAGNYEFATVIAINGNTLTLQDLLTKTYSVGGNSKAQVLHVPHYHNVTVQNSGVLTAHAWNGSTGGIVAFRASGEVRLQDGVIDVEGKGFTGGVTSSSNHAEQGDSATGNGNNSTSQNGTGGGGGALGDGAAAGGGGGGGYGSSGTSGLPGSRGGGVGGSTGGSADMTSMIFGGAGGGGGYRGSTGGGTGAASGGIIFVAAHTLTFNGAARVTATGNVGGNRSAGDDSAGGGGGGAGGSILLQVANGTLGTAIVTATGGAGGLGRPGSNNDGGAAGVGRIRVEYCESFTGSTNPVASTQKLDCYIVEQVNSAPYDQARLNLPEAISGTISYAVQYGRQYTFTSPGEQTHFIRLPKKLYGSESLDALIGNTNISSGALELSLDIGNDGTFDWTYSAATDFPTTLPITGMVDALNAYLIGRTDVEWDADIDVPVRIQMNRQADLLLTNLALNLQFNQPAGMAILNSIVDLGAERPLDWTVIVTGTHNQGEWITYTHSLGPSSQSLHPIRVYSQDYDMLGVGRYATDYSQTTVPGSIFGDGHDGDLLVTDVAILNSPHVAVVANAIAGENVIFVESAASFEPGDRVLILQTQGITPGNYEIGTVSEVNTAANTVTLNQNLLYSYRVTGSATLYRDSNYGGISETFTSSDDCLGDNSIGQWTASSIVVSPGTTVTLYFGCLYGNEEYTFSSNIPNLGSTPIGDNRAGSIRVFGGKAQVILIPQYHNVVVQNGGVLTTDAWNGTSGGILAFLANGSVDISGEVSVAAKGFRRGVRGRDYGINHNGSPGESYLGGAWGPQELSNQGGGGGGGFITNEWGAGGGGAGYAASGSEGGGADNRGGNAGQAYGSAGVNAILLGSGGGGGGMGDAIPSGSAGYGGAGGGTVFIVARSLNVSGSVSANGGNGQGAQLDQGGGGGGSGGTIKLIAGSGSIGNGLVTSAGGVGGVANSSPQGGNGAVGRIGVEFCDAITGWTSPPAYTSSVDCYIVEQVETPPYDEGRLNLPESFDGSRTFVTQYGRRYVFSSAGQQTEYLRLARQVYGTASLEALVSNAGISSGTRGLCLDVGNDGLCDYTQTETVNFPTDINVDNVTTALNDYLLAHNEVAWGNPIDVPVRVQVDGQADVILTNLALTPVGTKTRYLRLPAQDYDELYLDLLFEQPGVSNGPLSFTVDVGVDGTIDWVYAGSPPFPATIGSSNLAVAFNDYLSGRSGEVDVPIRIVPSPYLETILYDFQAVPGSQPDSTLTATDISFMPGIPTESETATATAVLHNSGTQDSNGVTAAFFATLASGDEWYIGSDFVSNIPAGGTAMAEIPWNTAGFTGTIPVRVQIDPYNRLGELLENNNQATQNVTVLTRPDLQVSSWVLSDVEPVVGEAVTVTLNLVNAGQTTAVSAVHSLYLDNPTTGGALLDEVTASSIVGGGSGVVTFSWTSNVPGLHRLFVQVDKNSNVNEYDEGNNLIWQDVYVGFAGPLLLDSGAGASDPAYTNILGYGFIDSGQPDVSVVCGGNQPEASLRRDPSGEINYRFDHLLPGHFYHLDLTLRECDSVGRQENIYLDGVHIAGPEDLGDGEIHRLSLRIDPALYADRTISLTVSADGIDGAVIAEVNLYDIDYRYADVGGLQDPAYPGGKGFGWLDENSVASITWGTLPYQSVRVDQSDNDLRYRFDNLDPNKRYFVTLTFWQPSGTSRIQNVEIDSMGMGVSIDTGDYQRHDEVISVPQSAYANDGSVIVRVLRVNADTGAMINEIALEEETLPFVVECNVQDTPTFSQVYGSVLIDSQLAPIGSVVQAISPRGHTVGCFTTTREGLYGFMRLYGEDNTANPPIPGMRAGEPVSFRVNGVQAITSPLFYWQDDQVNHRVDLNAAPLSGQFVLLSPGWNWFSTRLTVPNPLVSEALDSINGKYDRLLGENGIYVPSLPPMFNTLSEIHPGLGHMIRITEPTSVNMLLEGVSGPVTTPIPLHSGWNWVGYLPDETLPVVDALQSIDGNYQLVLSQDGTYDPDLPEFSTLQYMSPGEGYMIYATNNVTLVYPESTVAFPLTTAATVTPSYVAATTPSFTILYGDISVNGFPAPPGTLVETRTDAGVIVGQHVVTQAGKFGFMRVYGADGTAEPVIPGYYEGESIKFFVNGVEAESNTPTIWQNDWARHEINLGAELTWVYLPLIVR